jgi:peptidyl-dipeptidase A
MSVVIDTTVVVDPVNSAKTYTLKDLQTVMAVDSNTISATNYEDQRYYYQMWSDTAGQANLANFSDYVSLANAAATEVGYKDAGDMWRSVYEDKTFEKTVSDLWDGVKPFYEKLHGFVRFQMNAAYGPERVGADKNPLPGHIMGEMWASDWSAIYPLVTPYPNSTDGADISEGIKSFSIDQIFKSSADFQTSLGREPTPQHNYL